MEKITKILDFTDELADVPNADRHKALNEVGKYLLDAVLNDVGEAKSPVTGRPFKKLSADYSKEKAEESSSPIANLELSGDMLDALTYRIRGNSIEFGIWGEEADKADGHNNFSGDSDLPRRPFIPKKDENFRPEIRDEIDAIIEEFKVG